MGPFEGSVEHASGTPLGSGSASEVPAPAPGCTTWCGSLPVGFRPTCSWHVPLVTLGRLAPSDTRSYWRAHSDSGLFRANRDRNGEAGATRASSLTAALGGVGGQGAASSFADCGRMGAARPHGSSPPPGRASGWGQGLPWSPPGPY